MEAWSLKEPQEAPAHAFHDADQIRLSIQFTNTIEKNSIQPQFGKEKEYDETMFKTEDNIIYQVMSEVKVPYKIIKTCPVLCRNIWQ